MLEKIRDFAKEYNMFPNGCEVVCGLSGGADSVCLLLSLNELSSELGISKISALHVNHCLRGTESDRDEEYCRELCENLGIEIIVISCKVKEFAEKNKLSIEESARIMRYEAFAENSKDKIMATAHNSNDNIETVIHNLARGTALKGLCGIPPVRDNIVRPLLQVSRIEIEKYLKEKNISFVTDSTNLSDDYTRNKIRHNIIPLMEQLNSSLIKTSSRSLNVLRLENSFIETETKKVREQCQNGNCFKNLENFHKAIRQRCIAEYLTENKLAYSYERLEMIDNIIIDGGKLNISNDFYIISDGKIAEFKTIEKKSDLKLSSVLKIGENSIFDGIIFQAEIIKKINLSQNVHKKFTNYLMDYDKIKGVMILRNRRSGDKIKLSGRNFNSSIKKLINSQVKVEDRPFLHFIDDEIGVVFAEKIGIADRVKIDENTVNILKITIKGGKNA